MLGRRKTIKKCNWSERNYFTISYSFLSSMAAAWTRCPVLGADHGAVGPEVLLDHTDQGGLSQGLGSHQLSSPAFHGVGTSAIALCEHCCVRWHQRRHKHSVWSISWALLPALSHLCIKNGNEEIELSDSGLNF